LPPLFSLCEGVTLPDGTCASKPRSNLVEREVNPPLKTAMLGLSITATTAALIFGGVAYGLQKGAHCDATSRRCDDQASLDRAHTARTMAWVSTFSTGAAVASGVAYFLLPTRKVHIDFGAAPSGATVALGGWLP
jgi:hypothetical protein